MLKLIKKDFKLAMHPTMPIMLSMTALIFTPNYPYSVSYFYMTLAIFFTCLSSRENSDMLFNITLPISRKEAVSARICFFAIYELIGIIVSGLVILLKNSVAPSANAAGLDANLAVLAEGLGLFSLFNLIFFGSYFRDINRVGISFIKATIATFIWMVLVIVATYTIPFVRDRLDNTIAADLSCRVATLAACCAVFAATLALTVRISVKRFEMYDVR